MSGAALCPWWGLDPACRWSGNSWWPVGPAGPGRTPQAGILDDGRGGRMAMRDGPLCADLGATLVPETGPLVATGRRQLLRRGKLGSRSGFSWLWPECAAGSSPTKVVTLREGQPELNTCIRSSRFSTGALGPDRVLRSKPGAEQPSDPTRSGEDRAPTLRTQSWFLPLTPSVAKGSRPTGAGEGPPSSFSCPRAATDAVGGTSPTPPPSA